MRIRGTETEKSGFLLRIFFRFIRKRLGRVPPPLHIYAYRPAIMWSFLRLARAINRKGALSPRLKGLALYWTARTVNCSFCVDLTDRLAREAGISGEEIAGLTDFRNSSLFTETEKAVLEYTEAVTRTPAQVPEELFRRLLGSLDEQQMVELTATIALENFSARFNRAFGIEKTD